MPEDVPTRPANHSPADESGPPELWLVSYADDDDREMKAEEIFVAIRRGEIDGETIVWREGMAEWQAITETPELQGELERLAGKSSEQRKRTVMGGFGARTPRPLSPPRPNGMGSVPRNTLIGTGAHLAAVDTSHTDTEVTAPLSPADNDEDLDSSLLESFRPPAEASSVPSQTATAPLPGVRRSDDPGTYDRSPSSVEAAPISLNPDSIVSLPSDALESVVAHLPPTDSPSAPRGIFEIDSMPAPAPDADVEMEEPPLKAHEPPPHPPTRARTVSEYSAIEAPTIDPSVPPEAEKRGGTGKVLLFLLLFAGMGAAMFYVGRQSATKPAPAAVTPTPTSETQTAQAATTEPSDTAAAADGTADVADEAAAAAETDSDSAETNSAETPSDDESEAETEATQAQAPTKTVSGGRSPRPAPKAAPQPVTTDPKPAPKAAAPAETTEAVAGPFDPSAASAALERAAASASSCRKEGDPSGVASVTVTFAPSGRATNANLSGPPFSGTTTGGCIASRMRTAKIPPFSGPRMTVKKTVVIR